MASLKLLKESVLGSEQKFKEAKLKDGITIIKYDGDMPAVGMPVMTITEQGELPMPDGEHELEDGTIMVIVGGVISEIKPAAAEENEDPNKTPAPNDMGDKPINTAQAKAIVESIVKETRFAEQITELKNEIAGFKTVKESFSTQKEASEKEIKDLKEKFEKQTKTLTELFALVEKIGNEGSESPAGGGNGGEGAPVKRKTAKELSAEFRSALKNDKK